MENYKNCGIYKITSPTGRVYIGQAVNIILRWKSYKKPTGAKDQKRLHNSFKKYGVLAHQFDVIEYCSVEDLNCSERFWQDEFEVIGENGLNGMLQGCDNVKRVISKETLQRRSHTVIERKHFARGKNPKARIVLCTQTGIFYDCIKDAADAYNIRYYTLKNILKQKSIRINKTSLVCIDNYTEGMLIERESYLNNSNKKVLNTETGEEYSSIKQASEITKINYSTLRDYLRNRSKNKTNLIIIKNEL